MNIKNLKDLAKFVLAVLFFGATVALAVFDPVNDDTDIFLANPNIASERPNVLLAIDNSANWSGPFDAEKLSMVQVISGLSDAFNVGMMVMPETGGGNDSVDGGYLRFAVRRMTTTNKNALALMINNFDSTADKGNNTTHGAMLYEAYLYFAGLRSVASHGKVKTDKDNTTDPILTTLTNHGLPASDGSTSPAPLYRTPYSDGCARSFIILISNGKPSNSVTEAAVMQGRLAALTGVNPPAQISVTPNGAQSNWSDEMAKFMANADVLNDTTAFNLGIPNSTSVQNVYTYVVEVDRGNQPQDQAWTAVMQSTANNGKGHYFGVSSAGAGTEIVNALLAIFAEVQAVNSVFASSTLPVSVNVRGTNLNQVYIGVFRPDSAKAPRWLGNLKMYNLALNTANNTVFLADATNGPPPATGNPAENSSTGFISQSAPSFWTTGSTFWTFRQDPLNPSVNGAGGASDLPDGDLVEKGGAAQQLRIAYAAAEASASPRNLYTCTTGLVGGIAQDCAPSIGFALSGTPFNTTNDAINAVSLGLDTRPVSPLTAYATQPVTNITDRIPVTLSNTWLSGVFVTNISNVGISVAVSTLTTAVPKTITSLNGSTAGQVPNPGVGITSIAKSGGNFAVTLVAPGFAGASAPTGTVFTITCTAGVNFANFNSLSVANRTVTRSSDTSYTINASTAGNKDTCTAGSVTMPGLVAGNVITVTMPSAHGFTNGQTINIAGATPINLNGPFNIACTPIPTCAGATTFTYNLPVGQTAGAGTPGTAAGNSSTATATTAAAHGFANGSSVTITGASGAVNSEYNGSHVISCTPAPGCAGSTTFTYSTGTVVAPNTNPSVFAFQGGGTSATVTTNSAHGFNHGQTIYITGSDVAGYNGAFTISCPPFTGGSPCTTTTTFVISTASAQPANTSFNVYASATVDTFVLGVAQKGHALSNSEFIVIDGPAPAAGTRQVQSNFSTDYYFYYIDATLATPITSVTNTVRSRDNARVYVTIPNHGYANGQQVRIAGANPAGYNGEPLTARVCVPIPSVFFCTNQADVFSYPLTAALGANTSSGVTSSIKSTLAKATSVNHGFTNGSTVAIAGASPGAFNGTYTITVTGADTFTYTIGSVQGDATGTILGGQASGASPERDNIIRWVRGQDNFQDENVNSSTTDIRASVHGDVLHSRPAVVNYNRFAASDNDVFVFYGGNDGVFHAIKGGYANPTGFTPATLLPGQEAWGFVPQEFFGKFKRLRNNSPIISSSFKRPYFMDGPIGVHTEDNCCLPDSSPGANGKLGDTGDKVNLYIANKRGGRFLYALDVNNPVNPKFLWKIDNATTGFSELGQTWSQPTVMSNGAGGVTIPLVLFGAGYDEAVDDLDPAVVTGVNASTGSVGTSTVGTVTRTMGRGIYVVNAATGALIWSAGGIGSGATKEVAGMIYAIPSDITVVRNETTGIPNRGYVGDTGGNMWRIDFKKDTSAAAVAANPNNLGLTTVTKLASIANQATAAGRRKFLFPPDVVGQVGFDAVLVGSGDREHPFDSTVTNRFYMFKDKGNDVAPVTGTTTCDPTILEGTIPDAAEACAPIPGPIPGMSDLTSNCIQAASGCLAGETQAGVSTKLGTDRGWFITLGNGEKVVGNAVSIGGTTFFNTNQPSATAGGGSCGSNLGIARQYQVASADATATADLNAVGGLTGADRSLVHAGGGYLPSPVHVVVMLGGKPVEAVISGVQVSTPPGATLSARLRKFWYKEVDPR